MTVYRLMNIMILVLFVICFGSTQFLLADSGKDAKLEPSIHIDIPVVLKKANVVFNMDHLAFAGDMPVGIKYMQLLSLRFKEMGTEGQIICTNSTIKTASRLDWLKIYRCES